MKEGAVDNFDLFADFDDAERRLIESIFVTEHKQAGHVFMREGESPLNTRNALYLVVEGSVEVTCKRPDGDGFAVKASMGAGELFGIVGLVAQLPRSATCTAEGNVAVAYLDRIALEHLRTQHSRLAARFELMLARQLVRNLRRLTSSLAHALATGEADQIEGMFNAG